MRRRVLLLVLMVAAMALLIAGVAAAAGGWTPGGDEALSPESSAPGATDGTEPVTRTDGVTSTDPTTAQEAVDETTSPESTETTTWGNYISGLRHQGDHTPAAVLKHKKVPGYYKHNPTTTTTATPTVSAPAITPATSIETPPTP